MMPSILRASQCGLTQKCMASFLIKGKPQTGQLLIILNGTSRPVLLLTTGPTTSGITSPAFLMMTKSPIFKSLSLIKSSL